MAVANSFISPLQSPLHLRSYEMGEDISFLRAECGKLQRVSSSKELNNQLKSTMSTESLSSLLMSLPEVVIPETVYNPLPLQCLAAGALPEAVREDIDRVLNYYSGRKSCSTGRMQSSTEAGSSVAAGAESGEGETSVRGDQVAKFEEPSGQFEEAVVESANENEGSPTEEVRLASGACGMQRL